MANTPTANFAIPKPAAGDINWEDEYAQFADLVDSRLMIGGMKNLIINGDFNISQRGTSFISVGNGDYTLDRWQFEKSGAGIFDVSQSTDTPNGNIRVSLKIDVTTADASLAAGDFYFLQQKIEGHNVRHLGFGTGDAKQVTISFWVKSPKTGTHTVALRNSAVNRAYVAEYTVLLADTWEKKSVTVTLDTTGTWLTDSGIGLTLVFPLAVGSDRHETPSVWATSDNISTVSAVNVLDNAVNNFFLANIQVEVGDVATQFEERFISQELDLCQRYLEVFNAAENTNIGVGFCKSTTVARGLFVYKVKKKSIPCHLISWDQCRV